MRGRNVNTMSTRRARRPDGRVYREMRKRPGGFNRRSSGLAAGVFVLIVLALAAWMFFH